MTSKTIVTSKIHRDTDTYRQTDGWTDTPTHKPVGDVIATPLYAVAPPGESLNKLIDPNLGAILGNYGVSLKLKITML